MCITVDEEGGVHAEAVAQEDGDVDRVVERLPPEVAGHKGGDGEPEHSHQQDVVPVEKPAYSVSGCILFISYC